MRSLPVILLALVALALAVPAGATARPGTAKRKRAGRHGRFRVPFALRLGGCGPGYVITARGSRGSHTRLKLAPPPCPPPGPD